MTVVYETLKRFLYRSKIFFLSLRILVCIISFSKPRLILRRRKTCLPKCSSNKAKLNLTNIHLAFYSQSLISNSFNLNFELKFETSILNLNIKFKL